MRSRPGSNFDIIQSKLSSPRRRNSGNQNTNLMDRSHIIPRLPKIGIDVLNKDIEESLKNDCHNYSPKN